MFPEGRLTRQTNSCLWQERYPNRITKRTEEENLIEKLMVETPPHFPLPLSFSNNHPKKPPEIISKL